MTENKNWTCDNCGQIFTIDPDSFDFTGCDRPGCAVIHTLPEPVMRGVTMSISVMADYQPIKGYSRDLCKDCYDLHEQMWLENIRRIMKKID
jgi:hypothetical protein